LEFGLDLGSLAISRRFAFIDRMKTDHQCRERPHFAVRGAG
jgi:hypothetical protein